MKEFLGYLKAFDLKSIFISPSTNGFIQFFRYVFVGGIATVVDWAILYSATEWGGIHYIFSAVISFIGGLATNFLLSKLLVFSASQAKTGLFMEFVGYALIGAVGLGLTVLIMYVFTEILCMHYMLSKIIATALVLAWNYLARKNIIYQ